MYIYIHLCVYNYIIYIYISLFIALYVLIYHYLFIQQNVVMMFIILEGPIRMQLTLLQPLFQYLNFS